jgi:hypothetical protein
MYLMKKTVFKHYRYIIFVVVSLVLLLLLSIYIITPKSFVMESVHGDTFKGGECVGILYPHFWGEYRGWDCLGRNVGKHTSWAY